MDRLTVRSTGIHVNYLNNYNNSVLCSEMTVPQIKQCMEKLAAYEDLNLEPEQVQNVYDICVENLENFEKLLADSIELKKYKELEE